MLFGTLITTQASSSVPSCCQEFAEFNARIKERAEQKGIESRNALETKLVTESDAVQQSMEDGPGRYAVFASRLRTAVLSGIRYSAYSSEVGEAFRPVTKPIVIRTLYGISWSYIIGDVTYAGYKARQQYQQLEAESQNPALKAKRLADEAKQALAHAAKSAGQQGGTGGEAPQASHHHGGTQIDPLQLSENGYIALVATRRAVLQSIIS